MAEIKIKINVDASPLTNLISKLDTVKGDLKDINKAKPLEQVEQGFDDVSESIDKTAESTKTLKQQLREMTNELQGLEPGTQRFNEVALAAGKLKDTIQDTNAVINATAGSGVENLSKGLAGVAGVGVAGFQGIASAQAIFGVESEKLQETLVKLQALAGLSDAIKSLGGLGDTLTNIKASFGAVAQAIGLANKAEQTGVAIKGASAAATGVLAASQGAQATATGAATVASNALNVSLLANPIFLLIAAIGAVVGAMAYFSEETETAEQFNDKLNETLEKQQGILDRQIEKTTRAADNRVKLLQAQGASEKEIFDAQQDLLRKEEDGRIKNLQQLEFDLQDKNLALRKAQSEGDEELTKSIIKEINSTRDKYKSLRNLDGQYAKDKQIAQATFDTDQAADEKKAAEELRKKQIDAYNKRLVDQKKYNQARLDAARRIKDLELELLEDGEVKEKQLAAEVTKRQFEDLQTKYGDYNKLNSKLKAEFDKQSELLTIQGEENQKKITDKYQKKREADLKEGNEKLTKIGLDSLDAGREKEIATREEAFNKEKEDLDKLLTDKKISFIDYQDALEILTEKGRKDIDAINDKYDAEASDKLEKNLDIDLETRKKNIETIKSSLTEVSGIFNEFASQTGNEFAGAVGNTFSNLSSALSTFTDESASSLDKFVAGVGAVSSIASGFISAQAAKNEEELARTTEAIDSSNQAQQESLQTKLDAGLISQEDYDKSVAALDAASVNQKNAEGKKAFDQSKKLQIAQAAISGLQGAVGAYASLAPIPLVGPVLGAAAAAVIAGFTASNIKKISATSFQSASAPSSATPSSTTPTASTNQAQPNFSLFGQNNNQNNVGPNGVTEPTTQAITVNSTVSVSEINAVQNKVAVQESRSTL